MIPGMTAPLRGPVSLSLPFAVDSAGHVRTALGTWLDHRGSDPRVVDDARLVATELVSNSLRHARPLANGTVLVRWQEEGSALVLSVCDGGGPTEPEAVEAAPYDVNGRGLKIVDALTAQRWVERKSEVHVVHVLLPLS